MAAMEQINAMVAKNLAETLVKPIYRKLHKLLREYHADPIQMQSSTGWQETRPPAWPPRDDMTISMGMSVGERGQRMGALQQIMGMHGQDLQAGKVGILSSDVEVYRARVDFARLAGLPNPDQYCINPQSPQAQQAAQAMQQQAQQAQQAQMEQAQQSMQFQYSLMTDIEKVKGQFALERQQMQEQSKQMMEQMRAMLEQQKQQLDTMTKMMGHRVKLAEIDADMDAEEGKREAQILQADLAARAKIRKGGDERLRDTGLLP
jgi:hypothetical protein